MRKHLLYGLMVIFAIILNACGSTANYKAATSETAMLGKNVLVHPIVAELSVAPQRVSATLNADELTDLNMQRAKETVGAKALKAAKADVLVAPRYEMEWNAEKKLSKLTVVGYAATYANFHPATHEDAIRATMAVQTSDQSTNKTQRMANKVSNTQIVAMVDVTKKISLNLKGQNLAGLNEKTALVKAREQMLKQSGADFLIAEQYEIKIANSVLEEFVLTAYPASYKTYRKYIDSDKIYAMGTEPRLLYNTVGDLKPIDSKVAVKCTAAELEGLSRSQIETKVRNKALNQYKADVLLNEYFQIQYAADGKSIAEITILGTPAIYTDFHVWQSGEVLDPTSTVNADGTPDQAEGSILDKFLNLFKKK